MWAISKLSSQATEALHMLSNDSCMVHILSKIIKLIDAHEWNRARTLWILAVLKLKPENLIFSLFGLESEFFVDQFLSFQERIFHCVICNKQSESKNEFYLKKDVLNDKLVIYDGLEQLCKSCKTLIVGKFKTTPFCIFVQLLNQIDFIETLLIDDKTFNLISFSLRSRQHQEIPHFKSIFYLQKSFYEVDDLYPQKLIKNLDASPNISYCLYYLV